MDIVNNINDENQNSIARRVSLISPFYVMQLLTRAKELENSGRDIIHMEVGEPDFETVPTITKSAIKAIEQGKTKYTPAFGIFELREQIANYYQQNYGVNVLPERIAVTSGASGALLLALGSIINPLDKVLIADPGYPCNKNFIQAYDGIPVSIPVDAHTNFQLSNSLIDQFWDDNTKAVIISTPSNPTGTILANQEMKLICDNVAQRGGVVIVDEIYHGLTYVDSVKTALAIKDDLFIVNSFSKYFGMTGWRLGWMVVPEKYIEGVEKLAQNIFIAPATVSQYAALAAFDSASISIFEQRKAIFKQRRDYLLPQLREMGFVIENSPEGAFYLYANCEKFTNDSFSFCSDMLEDIGVAITPGKDFGDNDPQKFVRFAYANSMEHLKEGVSRIRAYVQK